jgi:4-hydroxy-tetrahydrodipicolinate synthase
MKKFDLSGVHTAFATPHNGDASSIDWNSFDKLVQRQAESGVRTIVLNGTTGESPTTKDGEIVQQIVQTRNVVSGRCQIMVGTGTNSTEETIKKTKLATDAGADAILLVNPYYNKPPQRGMFLHFKAVADSTKLPVVLYNIPGRTGINLETSTLFNLLHGVENIIGIKEASGDLIQIEDVCNIKADNFGVLSGDDSLTFKLMQNTSVRGVVSVASNIVPEEMVQMVDLLLKGNIIEAQKINERLTELFRVLFVESNPIPVKYALSLMGLCKNVLRLPLVPIAKEEGKLVAQVLKKMNLI